jgi:predicted transcriptional regulator
MVEEEPEVLPSIQAVRILRHCEENTSSVSQILAELGGRYEATIDLIRELSMRSLVQITSEKNGVGRPSRIIQTTPLGKQFIEQFDQLSDIRLQSNENDIKKAVKQAEEVRKLVELGVDPYIRFQEVNEIARNIASTTQISRHP